MITKGIICKEKKRN